DGPVNGSTLARAAAPIGEGVRFQLVLTNAESAVVTGDNVLAVEVHQNATTSTDVVWGTDIHASLKYCVRIDDPAEPRDTNVVECKSATLRVVASGAPPPTYQWIKDGVAILGATARTFRVTNMTPSHAGS